LKDELKVVIQKSEVNTKYLVFIKSKEQLNESSFQICSLDYVQRGKEKYIHLIPCK